MATKEKDEKYIQSVGRRKTAIARARITPSTRTTVFINGKDINTYFSTEPLRATAMEPFLRIPLPSAFSITVRVSGGGISGQAAAVRHAISRALTEYDSSLRLQLKKEGFLKRDPRAKERRHFGFVKARKRKQWSKR